MGFIIQPREEDVNERGKLLFFAEANWNQADLQGDPFVLYYYNNTQQGGTWVEFREFKYIKTIAELGSFTKAAAALYVSQPSLSHLVARTEAELGVTLFDRNAKPLRLTYAGEVYLRHAQDILDSNEEMIREFRDLSNGVHARLVIGMPYERAAYMLPQMITMLHQEFPGLELDIRTGGTPKLCDMLQKGDIQFAVMPIFGEEPWMASTLIYEEELCLAAGPNMIKASDCIPGQPDTVDFSRLTGKPFVLQRPGHIIRDAIDLMMKSYNVEPNVVMEVDGNSSAYRMSTAGLGLSIVPRMTTNLVYAPGPHYLYRLMDKVPVTWEVRAVYRKDFRVGTVERRFFEIIRDALRDDNYNHSQQK